jgi:16S rRNA (adenine1518-N6/adenine1519-N6)-dimethyltransferase
VEIGPGPGALTGALLGRIHRLHAVEIDRDLAALLRRTFPPEKLDLHEGDALSFDFLSFLPNRDPALPAPSLRLVGNLPYNISSPLLIRTMALCEHITDMHFMLQKEVVERIAARPGTSAFGRLSVMLAACFESSHLFDVPPESFEPPPRVDSAVVRLVTKPAGERLSVQAISKLELILSRAFAQKRKMLRSAFVPWLQMQGLDSSTITGTDRAEDVPAQVYFTLAQALLELDRPQPLRSINSIL